MLFSHAGGAEIAVDRPETIQPSRDATKAPPDLSVTEAEKPKRGRETALNKIKNRKSKPCDYREENPLISEFVEGKGDSPCILKTVERGNRPLGPVDRTLAAEWLRYGEKNQRQRNARSLRWTRIRGKAKNTRNQMPVPIEKVYACRRSLPRRKKREKGEKSNMPVLFIFIVWPS